MAEYFAAWVQSWIHYKTWLVENIGLTNDALHVHGALLIVCVSALCLRIRPDNIICWIIVMVAELFNEYADIRGVAPGEATINAGLHDIYNTMFWPTILVIFGRLLFPPRMKIVKPEMLILSDSADQSFEQPPTI